MPPWNAAGPSAPLATYCSRPIGPTPARSHAVRHAAQMSRVPAISPPQKIGWKFISVFLSVRMLTARIIRRIAFELQHPTHAGVSEIVFEVVRVFAVGNDDVHLAAKVDE